MHYTEKKDLTITIDWLLTVTIGSQIRDDTLLHFNIDRSEENRIIISKVNFINCTFRLQNENYAIAFKECKLTSCIFEDCNLERLNLSFCNILTNISSINCKIHTLKLGAMLTAALREFLHNENMLDACMTNKYYLSSLLSEEDIENYFSISNVDLSNMEYYNFEYLYHGFNSHDAHIFGNLEENILYVITKALRLSKPNRLAPIGEKCIGYKFVELKKINDMEARTCKFALAMLEIDKHSPRLASICSNKCRAAEAKVLSISPIDITYFADDGFFKCEVADESIDFNEYTCISPIQSQFAQEYKVNEIVTADTFDEDDICECSNGISFFASIEDTLEYFKDFYGKRYHFYKLTKHLTPSFYFTTCGKPADATTGVI